MGLRVDWDVVAPFLIMFILVAILVGVGYAADMYSNHLVRIHTAECKQIRQATHASFYQYDNDGNCYISNSKIQHFSL